MYVTYVHKVLHLLALHASLQLALLGGGEAGGRRGTSVCVVRGLLFWCGWVIV